jgi:eukaryotic-like serine/threonine-protein kinase
VGRLYCDTSCNLRTVSFSGGRRGITVTHLKEFLVADDELIDGIYKLVMCIATGGSSQVWECVEQASGRHLAMKLLKEDSPDFKENKASLKHEADVLKTLDHPLIVKFEKYSSSRDNTYMVMEHFRAANVKLQIKSDIRSVHVRARKLFESICQAMSHVHSRGWIHRDIKPDNVLMNKVGEIRLVDFSLSSKEVTGFAKMMGGGKIKAIQGTRTYIAPETIRKLAPTFQTDLYSLGIFFFEVMTGRTPFQASTPEELLRRHLRDEPPNPSEFNSNVSPEMDRLVFRLLKKKPTDRPASVDEVLNELKRIRIFKEDVSEAITGEKKSESEAMNELTDLRLDSRADAKLSVMLQENPELARQFALEKEAKNAVKKAKVAQQSKVAKEALKKEKAAVPAPAMMPAPMMMPQMMPPQMMPPQMMPPSFGPPGGFPQFPPQPAAMMPPQPMPPAYAPQGGFPQFPPQPGPLMPPGSFPPGSFPPAAGPGGMPLGGGSAGGVPGMPLHAVPPTTAPHVSVPPATVPPSMRMPQAAVPGPAGRPASSPAVVPTASVPTAVKPKPEPAKPSRPPAAPQPAPPVNPDDLEYMTELPDIL